MADRNAVQASEKPGLTGRTVLLILIGFFAVVFLANGIMTYFALGTFDGVETEDAYVKGRAYNEVLADARAQTALGWRLEAAVAPLDGRGELPVEIRVTARDRTGQALRGLVIEAELWRSVHRGIDRRQVMQETAPGDYRAMIEAGKPGNWQLRLQASDRDGNSFKQVQDIILRSN